MAFSPGHGHESLRRGRWSSQHAEYFLTFVTEERKAGLDHTAVSEAILSEARRLETEGRWRLRTAVVMPEHVHLLVVLIEGSGLSESLRMLKGRLAPVLRAVKLRWQRGYYDHRLRHGEDRLPVFLYIFLNPYRARLVAREERWHGFYCSPDDWDWFAPLTDDSCPLPAWLL